MRKNKEIAIYFLIFVVVFLFSLYLLKLFIIARLNSNDRFEIENFNFTPKEINLHDITYRDTWIMAKFEKIKLKHFLTQKAFAFEGPGEIFSEIEKKKISVEGKVKGNFLTGNLDITTHNIKIEGMGNIKFYGFLEKWGKEKFDGLIELSEISVKKISEFFNYKVPFDGVLSGRIYIGKEKENLREIKFDIKVKNITQETESSDLILNLKGFYFPIEKRGEILNGILSNSKGEKITFNAIVTENQFEINFNSEGFSIDDLFKLIPYEIQNKFNLKIKNSKITSQNFNINFSKKKLVSVEFFNSTLII